MSYNFDSSPNYYCQKGRALAAWMKRVSDCFLGHAVPSPCKVLLCVRRKTRSWIDHPYKFLATGLDKDQDHPLLCQHSLCAVLAADLSSSRP